MLTRTQHSPFSSSKKRPKMQSMLNLRATHGVPLCLSGITHPVALSQEIADHDRRRKAMRKQRSRAREGVQHGNHEMGSHIINLGIGRGFVEFKGEVIDKDLDDILHDLFHSHLSLTAKAA